MKKLAIITSFFLFFSLNSFADNSHFIDFTKVLNESKPGAEAQKKLKEKFKSETKKLDKIQEDLKKQESEIISQKKTLSAEDFQKKVETLRNKVSNLQKDKQNSFNDIAKSRNDSKKALLVAVSPIIKKYMENNNIKIILDKKSVVMGDTALEITDQIITTLNKEVPSLKIN
jgi:Skp family chaperone for outer membrane proteins